jgi:hypothetical protein
MQTLITVILVIALIVLAGSIIRYFILKPMETPIPNCEGAYPADHRRSIEVYEKKLKNTNLISKVSLVVSVITGLVLVILQSI